MKYTGPKFKRCRREKVNLFWSPKYDVRKRRALPGQKSKGGMSRMSEYGKLLRNKQVLKRMYLLSEKQFAKLVTNISSQYAKNNDISHDAAVLQFLERRLDATILRAWFANTIMQARQMVNHGHLTLNGVKHNIPSTFVKAGDLIEVRKKLHDSPLYSSIASKKWFKAPSWLKVDAAKLTVEVLDVPQVEDINVPVDVLKVVEFYARV